VENPYDPSARAQTRAESMRVVDVEESPLGLHMPNAATVVFEAPPIKKGEAISAPQVMQSIANILAAVGRSPTIRTGRFGRRKSLGMYWVNQRLARVRTANDVSTAAH